MYVRIIVFFLFFILFMKSLLSPFSVLCGSFFIRTRIVRFARYIHTSMSSSIISDLYYLPCRKHSKAQRSQPSQAAKQARADQSATMQASRQSWLESACRRVFIQLAVFSKQTKKSKSPPGPTKMYNHSQKWRFSWCDARRVCPYTALSLRPFYFVHAFGVLVVFVDQGALGICKSPVCTENHGPLCPFDLFAFCSILPCERA